MTKIYNELAKPELNYTTIDRWQNESFRLNDLVVDVLRLDKIHPEISGNKWFKLKYYLEEANKLHLEKLASYGGAFSNHLLALASTAKLYGFKSVGNIRGGKPVPASHTLDKLQEFGMELRYLSKTEYDDKKKYAAENFFDKNEPDTLLIPEGGAGITGVRGAEEILSMITYSGYSHICCALGTGATLAGIINRAGQNQKIIGVSVLKGTKNLEPMNRSWLKRIPGKNIEIFHDAHFGGYAKKTQALLDFMNKTFRESSIPTDFIYTGKLFYAIVHLAAQRYFKPGSHILLVHTGGLQGNRSMQPGLLQF